MNEETVRIQFSRLTQAIEKKKEMYRKAQIRLQELQEVQLTNDTLSDDPGEIVDARESLREHRDDLDTLEGLLEALYASGRVPRAKKRTN